MLAGFKTVHVRHERVQKNNIRCDIAGDRECLLAFQRYQHGHMLGFQRIAEHVNAVDGIVDYQHHGFRRGRFGVHGRLPVRVG